ncbi:MAG: hypothetical protein ACUVXJ_09070 [Phycisphaerae bacterium]
MAIIASCRQTMTKGSRAAEESAISMMIRGNKITTAYEIGK